MGYIIILIIIVIIMAIVESDLDLFFLGSSLSLLVGLILHLTIGTLFGFVFPTKEIVTETPIYALNDVSSIDGTHYLFSGYIDEELVYYYVTKTEKGKHIEKLKTDNVYFNEGDYVPKIIETKKKYKYDFLYLFANDIALEETCYVIYIPENSITTEYNIDLQ